MVEKIYKGWGACLDCGYQGMLEYVHVTDESYSDPEALGVVMGLHCPACESHDHALLTIEYYRELLADNG
jgi:Zn ribbon nucleic-acid-binding protein